MNKIILTGGGTAGHVTPNIALVPVLRESAFDIGYIGTVRGIERGLIANENIPFYPINSGKLRRYFDGKNVTDLLRIAHGTVQSFFILRKLAPDVVFSKGGFVACPAVWAAWLLRIPVIIHESDITPGLANRLCFPFAQTICYSFPETAAYSKKPTSVYTGLPVRKNLLEGEAARGKSICGFTDNKPVLLVMGGSQGSVCINQTLRNALVPLLPEFNICHICGKGNLSSEHASQGYAQFEYVTSELPHLFAAASIFTGRSGATTLFELLLLKKPALFIPLSTGASRGDQILNALSFKRQGFCHILEQERLSVDSLCTSIRSTFSERSKIAEAMKKSDVPDGTTSVMKIIRQTCGMQE